MKRADSGTFWRRYHEVVGRKRVREEVTVLERSYDRNDLLAIMEMAGQPSGKTWLQETAIPQKMITPDRRGNKDWFPAVRVRNYVAGIWDNTITDPVERERLQLPPLYESSEQSTSETPSEALGDGSGDKDPFWVFVQWYEPEENASNDEPGERVVGYEFRGELVGRETVNRRLWSLGLPSRTPSLGGFYLRNGSEAALLKELMDRVPDVDLEGLPRRAGCRKELRDYQGGPHPNDMLDDKFGLLDLPATFPIEEFARVMGRYLRFHNGGLWPTQLVRDQFRLAGLELIHEQPVFIGEGDETNANEICYRRAWTVGRLSS